MVCQLIQDHPRRCGENKEAQAIKVLCTGSPPQVRGKLSGHCEDLPVHRITPAGAGKTYPGDAAGRSNTDHPRRCGENRNLKRISRLVIGSPPQVRGKLIDKDGVIVIGQDHPRRCGENGIMRCRAWLRTGSPPQVRGKPKVGFGMSRLSRITPAGAGKTVQVVRCKDCP